MNARGWRKVWLTAGATVGLLALVWLVGTALAQGPEREVMAEGDVSIAATVGDKINYQGRLTDTGGTPLDGTYPMRFEIYDSNAGPTLLWDSGIMSVDVDQGLFNVELAVDPADFNGQALWLRIYVDGDWLFPRQELLPVPYALSLRPGAHIKGVGPTTCSAVLKVENDAGGFCGWAVQGIAATGAAVWGESTGGLGVRGYTEDLYAVYGSDGGTTQAKGYGGYFETTTGVGVYGYSSAERTVANNLAPGVYGRSENGVGVYGVGESDRSGVLGESTDATGVHGRSANGNGVYGYSDDGNGVRGRSQSDYAGYFTSQNFRGLYARSDTGWYDAYFDGTFGVYVAEDAHVGDDISAGDDIHAAGDITAGGSKGGYVVEIALNDGREPLELGDVVLIMGAAEPILGSIPVPKVRKASEANSTAVIGVVDRQFVTPSTEVSTQETEADIAGDFVGSTVSVAEGGGIAPGEYVGVVTLGSFRGIKVDASYGAVQPGDLLVSSDTPGYAMKATNPQVGTIIGKALGSLDSGTGVIPVLVTLH
jgi:hypothetical protein